MLTTYGKFIAIACAATSLSGHELLLENRDIGNAAVVAVPTPDWYAVGAAGSREQADTEISNGLVAAIADKFGALTTKAIAAAEATNVAATIKLGSTPQKGIQPIKGSESIPFSSQNNGQLSGCSTLGVIELHHTGSLEDALIVLRNETHRMNSNLLLPIKASKTTSEEAGLEEINFKAQMMLCPISLSRGN